MTASSRDRVARVALGRLGEPGDPRLAALVAELGAAAVYAYLREERDVGGVATDVAARLHGLDPDEDLRRAAAGGIRFVCPEDAEWPGRLGDLDRAGMLNGRGGAPLGLWVRGPGRLDELCERSVAVVGSRSATSYGASVAGALAADLAAEQVTVVSGAAFGIDQAAHRGALAARGPTVAVLACGVDRAYPAAHRELLTYIAETGLVVAELAPGCAPTRLRFLARNRMIAALALGTVVVEAAVRSGALNTANWAFSMHRPVMGVPGPVTSAPSQGVHELIRTRDASLVTRGSDVLELVSPSGHHLPVTRRGMDRPQDRLTGLEQQVLDGVPVRRPAPTSSVARTAGVGEAVSHQVLSRLQAGGFVDAVGGGWRLGPAARPGDVGISPLDSAREGG
ncbi:MAG TPA: DNA-processing protein DprA [Nocardioidaceae bacterium]|nr:DNA-processing protein DprA [Nocardioidaceae bacterium]